MNKCAESQVWSHDKHTDYLLFILPLLYQTRIGKSFIYLFLKDRDQHLFIIICNCQVLGKLILHQKPCLANTLAVTVVDDAQDKICEFH